MPIFEPVGRFFFERNRLILLCLLISAPFLVLFFCLSLRFFSLRQIEDTFDAAALRARSALEKRAQKDRFLQRYTNSEPYFINQTLESIQLLSRELRESRNLQQHPACREREALSRRIAFLEGMDNRLAFAEENIRSSNRVKETEERLLHPVEVDGDDLDHLLTLIEGLPVGIYAPHPHSPQLLIQDFLLSKKNSAYELNLTLLKREFHEKKP